MKAKKQCPQCKEFPAWNKSISFKEQTFYKPVYSCGLCSFELPRKVYKTKPLF